MQLLVCVAFVAVVVVTGEELPALVKINRRVGGGCTQAIVLVVVVVLL